MLAAPLVVEHGEHVEQRGLACAGRAHDGNELSRRDVEMDAAKDESFGVAGLIAALKVVDVDHGFLFLLLVQGFIGVKARGAKGWDKA
jgi:hypothetical protein